MIINDERTEAERKTHTLLVVMTDKFMSGWGKAANGLSLAAWACTPDTLPQAERWVRSRTDARRVRVVVDDGKANRYRPRGNGHLHIYVVREGHPATRFGGWVSDSNI